jgi:hypothetical protein
MLTGFQRVFNQDSKQLNYWLKVFLFPWAWGGNHKVRMGFRMMYLASQIADPYQDGRAPNGNNRHSHKNPMGKLPVFPSAEKAEGGK